MTAVTLRSPSATGPVEQEAVQYNTQFTGPFSILDFVELGRPAIEQAVGGQPSWTAGVNFAAILERSPYKQEVKALYRAAGLDLKADLNTLSANADITADPAALAKLISTSVPTGRLEVPELDLHTIGDNLVVVQNENSYARMVRAAGSGGLLRQAYTASFGHCNFSPAELVAGVLALGHRVSTGHWDDVATPSSLEAVATSLRLGPARFADYHPGRLTGAVITPGQR